MKPPLIRIGLVHSVNAEECKARVRIPDMDNFVTAEFQVLQRNTLNNKDYYLPEMDEMVICIMYDRHGVILGSLFNKVDPPITHGQNIRSTHFMDGTSIIYDRESHTLDIDIQSNTEDVGIFNLKCDEINIGTDASEPVVHATTLDPIFGIPLGEMGPLPFNIKVPIGKKSHE